MIFKKLAPLLTAVAMLPAIASQDDSGLVLTNRQDDSLRSTASETAAQPVTASQPAEETAPEQTIPPSNLPIPYIKAPDDLLSRLRAGFKMPRVDDPLVHKWENYYASRPQFIQRVLERSRPYLYHVADEVEKRGMPMELALLPFIESAYNPQAVSPAQAAGMWQFIPGTGKRFGLERTWWYDGRRDVVAATSAALNYLGELYGMFGDWSLALASYNWGENAVARAVSKKKTTTTPEPGYLDIKMPNETRNYVPKLLAVRNIISNPAAFGVALLALPNKPYFTAITPGKHMDVKVAAELAEIPVEELLRLNPGFVRPVIAHKEDRHLILPADKVEAFNKNLASYDKPLLNWQPYVTKSGESYAQLAQRYGMNLDQLKDINDIPTRESRARGQTILVPKSADIARKEQATLTALASNRKGVAVDHGDKDGSTTTPPPPKPAVEHATDKTHRVAAGETLYSIAKSHNLSADELKKINKLNSDKLRAGQELRLSADAPSRETTTKTREYIVRKGDTLAEIAKQHQVSIADLQAWNKLGKALRPGTKLIIR